MNWKQPTNVWQWLSLCTPAVAALLALWGVEVWMGPVPLLQLENGSHVGNVGATLHRMMRVTVGTMTGVSLPLAFVLTRGQSWLARTTNTLGLTFCLVFFNSFIAFGGCVAFGVASSIVSR